MLLANTHSHRQQTQLLISIVKVKTISDVTDRYVYLLIFVVKLFVYHASDFYERFKVFSKSIDNDECAYSVWPYTR